ncbi:MAG: hypothetical protein ACYTBZ_16795 [Planctomycetota bacterium]
MSRSILTLLIVIVSGCSLGSGEVLNRPAKSFMGLPLLYFQDFDRPVPDQWEPTDPAAWKFTRDGERSVYALAAKSNYTPEVIALDGLSLIKDICVSDFVLDAWIRSTGKEGIHRDMSIAFGYQDPTHYYYAHFGRVTDPISTTIHIINNHPRTSIAKTRSPDGVPWDDGYHHLRVVRRVDTGKIESYFDDMNEPVSTAEIRVMWIEL